MTYRAWELKTLDRAVLRELTHAIAEQATEELECNASDGEPWSEQKYAATLAAQQKENALLAGILTARGITDPADGTDVDRLLVVTFTKAAAAEMKQRPSGDTSPWMAASNSRELT